MKWLKLALVALLVLGSALPDMAAADRGRFRGHSRSSIGLFIGVPLHWGWPGPYYSPFYSPYPYSYYYPPYYAYPPVVTVPSSPPVYIEREDEADAGRSSAGSYWYYCDRPAGYYPDVKECPGGWERVKPRSSR